MDIGPSEAEAFWTAFLRKLRQRGLRGVKLVVSDAHEGLKAAVAKLLHASWQRCRVHFARNALAYAGRNGRRVVAAFIATAFAQNDAEAAKSQWRKVADQLRPTLPKLAALMDESRDRRAGLHEPSRQPTGPSCTRSTRSSGSTARSSAAPTWSASSPTRPRSPAWSAPSCSSSPTSGRSSGPAT